MIYDHFFPLDQRCFHIRKAGNTCVRASLEFGLFPELCRNDDWDFKTFVVAFLWYI
eukprot:08055.XXX_464074_464241_1 [CDS] Oithona nana genome sequencing.